MAGQATELFNLASSFDPYGAYRQGQMQPQKYDIQQAMLDEQTKEIEADKAAELGQQASQMGKPVALAKMANQMIPDAKLYNDDGTLTVAGQMNETMVNSAKLAKQGKQILMQAALLEGRDKVEAMSEGRRMIQTAQQDAIKAREMNDKVKSDSIYAAAMAKDQVGWDAALQSYQDSGLPLPKGIPTEYSPENAKKIAALAPAALQSKIANDQLKQAEDRRREKREERAVLAAEAKGRDNVDSGAKLTAESDKRLSQAETGLRLVSNIEGLLSNDTVRKEFDKNQFLRALLEQPKEMTNLDKYVKSNIYQSLAPETKDLITLLANTRNAYYKQNSGQAVTGGEAARNFFSVVQPSDNAETILRKINQQKPEYTNVLQSGIEDYKLTPERKKRYSGLIESNKPKESTTEAPIATPTQADLDYIAKNPSLESKFVARFGKKPSEFKKSK